MFMERGGPEAPSFERAPVVDRQVEVNNREEISVAPETEVAAPEKLVAKHEAPKSFEKLSKDQQFKILDELLAGMRDVVGPVRDYAVFASTAMYLNGEKIVAQGDEAGRELMEPPGDFDAAVFELKDLDTIRDRLRRMPDVIFSNAKKHPDTGEIMHDADGEVVYQGRPGDYATKPGEDIKILSGQRVFDVEIDGKKEKVAYDFEFFLNSRMVRQEAARGNVIESHGLKILNLDGLQRQYDENLNFELKIDAQVKGVVDYLKSNAPEVRQFKAEMMAVQEDDNVALTEPTMEIMQRLDIPPEDMKKVLEIQAELDYVDVSTDIPITRLSAEGLVERFLAAQGEVKDAAEVDQLKATYKHTQDLIAKRAELIAGNKTKIWKRDLNLVQLARLRSQTE